jgi:nicotinamidase-related amidase
MDAPQLGRRNNPDAEENIARLLGAWRSRQWPVIHIKHNSTEPESTLRPELPGNKIKAVVSPTEDEPVFEKTVNSAFVGTDLQAYLTRHTLNRLIVVGLTTDHCVSTTVRMAANLGYSVWLVHDATAAFEYVGHNGCHFSAEQVHEVNLASLHREFCTVIGTDEAISVGEASGRSR